MSKISREKRDRIIELWFAGFSRDEIAEKLKISGETVSRHIAQLKKPLTERAAERLEGLRLLSKELKDSGKTLPEVLSIASLHSRLGNLGVPQEDVEHFIVVSKKTAKEMGEEAKNYARTSIKLNKLEAETGKNYKEIIIDFEEKTGKINQMNKEIGQLDEKREESKKELEKQLNEDKLTRKDLIYASTLRDALEPHGFSLKDTSKIPTLIKHIQKCSQNPEKVLAKLERIDSLENATRALDERKKEKQKELEAIVEKTRETAQQYKELLQRVQSLQEQKRSLETKIAEYNQTTLPTLEQEKNRLSHEMDLMEKEIEATECVSSTLLTKKPTNIDALHYWISALKKIKEDPTSDLAQYRKIYEPKIRELLKDTFLDVFGLEFVRREKYLELQNRLETGFNNTKAANATLTRENETLKRENADLKEANKKLSDEKTALQKRLETLERNLAGFEERVLSEPRYRVKEKELTQPDITTE